MNWESSILNKIYRTKNFKISLINVNSLKDKSAHIEKVTKLLDQFNLRECQIRINENAALYKLKPNKNTYYFSFNLNSYFSLYASFFEVENKHLNYTSIWESEGNSEDELTTEEKEKKGKKISDLLKMLLIRFMFSNEFEDKINDIPLKEYFRRFDCHFKFKNYLLGDSVSLYDIILLSILFSNKENANKYVNIINSYEDFMKSNDEEKDKIEFKHLQRWIFTIKDYSAIDLDKLDKIRRGYYKEYLFETFRLTSNLRLVDLVMRLSALKEKEQVDKIEELKNANKMKYENLLTNNASNKTNMDQKLKKGENYIVDEDEDLNEDKIYEEIKRLLDSGENVNSREQQTFKTLSHLACKKRNMRLLKLLLKYDADMEAIDFEYMTPIYEAVVSGDFELCRFLIDDLKINLEHKEIQHRTAFYWVACNGDVEMIKYLITKGCDVNITSKMGRTPLSKACWNGKRDVVELLVKIPKIEINKPDRNGRYPLHNAVWGVNGGRLGKKVTGLTATDNPECAKLLIENGALIEVQDNEGYTPLMIAASTNGVESLNYLLEKNGNVNTKNKYGATALIECARYGNWECVKILLEKSMDLIVNARDNSGMSAIDYTILLNRIESLEIFLNKIEFTTQEYLDMIIMSLYSRKIKTFEYILHSFKEKKIIENFSFIHVYGILQKMIIIHQYDKFFLFTKTLSELADSNQLNFNFSEIELNIDLIILSVLSLKIYHINREKTKLSTSKDTSLICRSFDENGERDYDDFEDEIREKIMNNLKNNENMYNNLHSHNKDDASRGSCNINNTLSFLNLQNLDCLNSSISKNTCSSADDDKSVKSFESSENEKIRRFDSYLDMRVERLVEKKIAELINFKKILENKNDFENLIKEKLIPQKFIKLLIYTKSYDSLRNILRELSSISKLLNINYEELLRDDIFIEDCEEEAEHEHSQRISAKSFIDIKKLENLENTTNIKNFLTEILFDSEITMKEEQFNYKYSLNKRKKEDNYFGNWKKHLYTFNNHNCLSLTMKNVFDPEKDYNKEKEIFSSILNSEILGLYLFSKLKNHKNILHLIFPKTNTNEILDEILQFIRRRFSKKVKLLISMVNSIDRNNLTPIDIAIKKKNYDMVEVYTKIINEFLIHSEIAKKEKEIIEEINTNNALTNFIELDEYKDNVLYKIVNYKIRDSDMISIPEDYKNYLKKIFAELENKIKNISEKENLIADIANGNSICSNLSDFSKKINKDTTDLDDLAKDLCTFLCDYPTIADILKRNDLIIEEINENRLNSHFNFNRKHKLAQTNDTNSYNNNVNSNFYWVDNKEKLEFCTSHLKTVKYIGVDLEFHNYKSSSTYNGIVCVIQLSSLENTFAIDSLILDQKTIREAIKSIFEDEKILKVFHGCDNDLNFLISNYQIFTRNFIDTGRTYLAFQRLILNKSFKIAHLPSLSYLAKMFLKCELDKSYQKADWRIRPLTKNMLSYALADAKIVLYLFEIFVGLYNYLNEGILDVCLNGGKSEYRKDQNIYYEELIQRLRENKLSEKEMKTMKETSVVDKKNIQGNHNNRFLSLIFDSLLRSLEIIKQKINFEYKKIEISLN